MATLMPEGLLFSSSIKNNAEKIFLTTNSLIDAKYSLKNRTLYQVIENKSKRNQTLKWNKKPSRWVNVNFQSQADNRQTKNFCYNFKTKSIGNIFNFSLKTTKTLNLKTMKKTFSHKFFDWILSMNRKTKKVKAREEHIEQVLLDREKNHFLTYNQ